MALKGNQNALYEDVKLYFSDAKIRQEIREKAGYTSTTEKAHGQVEKREYYQTEEIKWLAQNKEWNGIKSIGMEEKTIRDVVNLESLNLLIAKQVPTAQVNADEVLSDAQLMTAEMSYEADVQIREGDAHGPYMDKEKFSLKTNLGTNLAGIAYMEAEGKTVDTPWKLSVN